MLLCHGATSPAGLPTKDANSGQGWIISGTSRTTAPARRRQCVMAKIGSVGDDSGPVCASFSLDGPKDFGSCVREQEARSKKQGEDPCCLHTWRDAKVRHQRRETSTSAVVEPESVPRRWCGEIWSVGESWSRSTRYTGRTSRTPRGPRAPALSCPRHFRPGSPPSSRLGASVEPKMRRPSGALA